MSITTNYTFKSGTIPVDIGTVFCDLSNNQTINGDKTMNYIKVDKGSYIELGGNITAKDGAAGKIGYETFTAGSVDIVGAGPATPTNSRNVKIWDNLTVTNNLVVSGAATVSNPASDASLNQVVTAKWVNDKNYIGLSSVSNYLFKYSTFRTTIYYSNSDTQYVLNDSNNNPIQFAYGIYMCTAHGLNTYPIVDITNPPDSYYDSTQSATFLNFVALSNGYQNEPSYLSGDLGNTSKYPIHFKQNSGSNLNSIALAGKNAPTNTQQILFLIIQRIA